MILVKSCSESLAVKVQTIERGYYRTYTGENYVQSRVKSADNLNFRPITSQASEKYREHFISRVCFYFSLTLNSELHSIFIMRR